VSGKPNVTRSEVATWVSAARQPRMRTSGLRELPPPEGGVGGARQRSTNWPRPKNVGPRAGGALTPDFGSVRGDLQALPPVDRRDSIAARLSRTPALWASRATGEHPLCPRRKSPKQGQNPNRLNLGKYPYEKPFLNGSRPGDVVSVPLGSRKRSGYADLQPS